MNKREKLLTLAKQIEVCEKCPLSKEATKAVPGSGNPETKVVFIGEAPGFHEDLQGKPFVGNAGKYLDSLLAKVGLKREEVFITNVVKHRPPENRDPTPPEIAACSGWLDVQLAILSPKVVVTLGRWSLARYALGAKISDVHGKPFRSGGLVVLPMYHPAAALRNGRTASEIEEDFRKNQKLLVNPDDTSWVTETFESEDKVNLPAGQGSLF